MVYIRWKAKSSAWSLKVCRVWPLTPSVGSPSLCSTAVLLCPWLPHGLFACLLFWGFGFFLHLNPFIYLESVIPAPSTQRHCGTIFRLHPPLGSHPSWSTPAPATRNQLAHPLSCSSGALCHSSETVCTLGPACSFSPCTQPTINIHIYNSQSLS